jgi:hypothetical protein
VATPNTLPLLFLLEACWAILVASQGNQRSPSLSRPSGSDAVPPSVGYSPLHSLTMRQSPPPRKLHYRGQRVKSLRLEPLLGISSQLRIFPDIFNLPVRYIVDIMTVSRVRLYCKRPIATPLRS